MRRRRSRMLGKLPWRSLGILRSTSPALVESSRSRVPLRCVVRAPSARSARPIWAVASASIRAWSINSTPRRTTSMSPPARTASSSSFRSLLVMVTGCPPWLSLLVQPRSPGGHLKVVDPGFYTTRGDINGALPGTRHQAIDILCREDCQHHPLGGLHGPGHVAL